MNGPESPDIPAESNSIQEQLPQPVKKAPKRKIKRAYSRSLKRGARDKKNTSASPDPPPSTSAVPSESRVVQRTATTQGAARNASKTELQRELKSVLEQNAHLQSQLDAVTKRLQSSESKREATSASLHSYQSKFRDSQKELKQAERMVDRQAKQLSISTEDIELIVQQKLEQQKSKHKGYIESLNRKHDRDLSSVVADLQTNSINKDKIIKNLRDICKANTSVAVELRSELSKARSEHANQLTDQQIKHRDDVMRERKKHAASNETLKKSLKMIQEELVETTNMSLDFADEYCQLRNTKNAELRQQTQKAEQMENLSKSRNEKLKKAKDNVQELRSSIDSITSTYDEQLAKAHSEIASLMDKLVDSEIVVESLQKDVAKAQEELIKLKPHVIQKKGGQWDEVVIQLKSLFYAAKKGAPRLRKRHDNALKVLQQYKLDKLKAKQEENAEKAVEENIVAMNYFEIGTSERRWKTPREANTIYNQLGSETAKLSALKEQIMIRRLGFGWEDCGHKWSCKEGDERRNYTSRELLTFLKETVLKIERKRGIPSEPATNYTMSVSMNHKLGTVSDLEFVDDSINTKSNEELELDAVEERERREQEFETDRQSRLQPNIMPKVDDSLVGFNVEYCFEYVSDDDDSTYLAWCDGVVHSIVNANSRMVMIKWNQNKLTEGDAEISRHKLGIRGWNPKTTKQGAWRKFVGDPNA